MENVKSEKEISALDLLNPYDYTIDEISAQFESYRKRRALEQLQVTHRLKENFALSGELDGLRTSLEGLRLGLQKLQQEQQRFQLGDVNAIIEAPLALREERKEKTVGGLVDPLVIRCGSSECIFDGCHRHVDSQLMLLHYITEHSGNDAMNMEGCHVINRGQRVILTFHPKHLHIRDNQVLGILFYSGAGATEGQQETHLPIVVLICKIAASVSLSNKNLVECLKACANVMNQVYLIWLVTPQDKLPLSASLCLCGRDSALKTSKVVPVRWLDHCEDVCHYTPVDKEYWHLSYAEMRQISNGFRDELNLEISLNESMKK